MNRNDEKALFFDRLGNVPGTPWESEPMHDLIDFLNDDLDVLGIRAPEAGNIGQYLKIGSNGKPNYEDLILNTQVITLLSNDKANWLETPTGFYFIANGETLGYPENNIFLFHQILDNRVSQLISTSANVYARSFNQSAVGVDLDWIFNESPSIRDILIDPTDWDDGVYTFTDSRITADNFWEIMNANDSEYTNEQWEQALALRLVLVSQAAGEMQIRNRADTMPTLAIPMVMKYLGGK
jgi:hypothetical protein